MKKFLCTFRLYEVNTIQLIKLIRLISTADLRESKIFVEEQILPRIVTAETTYFKIAITEAQLGRYLIRQWMGSAPVGVALSAAEEIPKLDCADLTAQ